MTELKLPKWFDLHSHLRQDALLSPIIKDHLSAGCAGILAMPNTTPPVAKIFEKDPSAYWSIEGYIKQIKENGGQAFQTIIVPLYLTKETTAEMITTGAESGLLRACKYYPPHGTTGAEFSAHLDHYIKHGVFEAMQKQGVILRKL